MRTGPKATTSRHTYRLWSQRVAAGLRKSGLQPGDRVLLFSGNTLLFPVLFMGVVMAGDIFRRESDVYSPRTGASAAG
jgi:4-coumarate--CoA ligase